MDDLPRGYYGEQQLAWLADAVKRRRPSIIVEVGTHLGRSALAIAKAMSSSATLYCVDHWPDGATRNQVRTMLDGQHLTRRVSLIRAPSTEAARDWPSNRLIDLIHLDADHRSLAVYLDIREWGWRLNPRGIFLGHDWFLDSVRFGVMQAQADGLLSEVGTSEVQRDGWPACWWALPGEKARKG